eukprot:10715505-Ditylum_brightwellii.AAC.1
MMESKKKKSSQVAALTSEEIPKKQKVVAKDANTGVSTANTPAMTDKDTGWAVYGTVVINNYFQGSPPN